MSRLRLLSEIIWKFVIAHHSIFAVATTRHPRLGLQFKIVSCYFDGNTFLSLTDLANNSDAPSIGYIFHSAMLSKFN
ncbi:MAG: hypothetical protein ACYDG2_16875 [Ruminiclostridium sp.]